MITLPSVPVLVPPTTDVRVSYLTGEQSDSIARGRDTDWLHAASEDFDAFVADRVGVRERWGVPSTVFWYVAGEHYLGSLVVRHELTPELLEMGGHVGYHVVHPWTHQGHATRMLGAGLQQCRRLGISRALLTCGEENEWSRRVIVANGGQPDETIDGELRFWFDLS